MTARVYTATECKHAARQALAMLTASMGGGPASQLVMESEGDIMVTASVLGMARSLLEGYDERLPGASVRWLHAMGQSIEAMPEGGE